LTKPTNLLDYLITGTRDAEEVAGHVQTGTRALGRAEADAGAGPGDAPGPVRLSGADGTLLAVVPIPGTGTSLAIVGYPVTAAGSVADAAGTLSALSVPDGATSAGTTAAGRPGLLLDHDQRHLWVDGAEVTLTFQEFELLAFLAAHPATVFSRADLVRAVWQRDFAADSRTVDVHVSRLRHKLGPFYGRCLVTEYRVGYQFRPVTS
jgi:Transcriptional regulatory protein, C terminal